MFSLRVRRHFHVAGCNAVRILAYICVLSLVPAMYGQDDSVGQLIVALKNPDPHVRQHAAYALGALKDPRAFEPLVAALGDSDDYVRIGAAPDGLGRINLMRGRSNR